MVIVCHDYGRFLGEAIESALRQTHPATEIVVVLDDCHDNSHEVAARYPVQTITAKCCDPYLARRLGARSTVSDVICFLDADDRLSDDYIEHGLSVFADPHVGIVTGDVEFFGQARGVWRPEWQRDIESICGASSAALVRHEAIRRSRCFEDFSLVHTTSEDWELWKRIVRDGWRVAKAPIIHHHRKHGGNRTDGPSYRLDSGFRKSDLGKESRAETPPPKSQISIPQSRRLRLAIVTQSLALGGVETMACSQVAHAEALEWVGVWTPPGAPRSPAILESLPRLYEGDRGLRRLIEQADVVYAWASSGGLIREVSEIAAPRPMIYGIHGQGQWSRIQAETVANFVNSLWCVSMGAVLAVPPAHRRKTRLIRGGVDLKRLAGGRGRDAIRREWGLKPGERAVGYIGRLSEEKNPLVIAKAVAWMPEAKLICCAPPSHDPGNTILKEMRGVLLDRLVPFHCNPAEIGEVYRGLDCLVVASHEEGMPTVMLEAWAMGVPVVATPVGMLLELEPRHGPLAEALSLDPSPIDVAGAVRRAAFGNKARMTTARELAINELNITRMVREFEGLARELAFY